MDNLKIVLEIFNDARFNFIKFLMIYNNIYTYSDPNQNGKFEMYFFLYMLMNLKNMKN